MHRSDARVTFLSYEPHSSASRFSKHRACMAEPQTTDTVCFDDESDEREGAWWGGYYTRLGTCSGSGH
jgi:hypothetical protein